VDECGPRAGSSFTIPEIATRPASENPDGHSLYAIPCVNPSKWMPYQPVTANEKAAIKVGKEQEDGTPDHWKLHVADTQVVIGSYGVATKMDRWNGISKRSPDAPKVAASPLLFARMWTLEPRWSPSCASLLITASRIGPAAYLRPTKMACG